MLRHYPGTIVWLHNGHEPTSWLAPPPGVPAGKVTYARAKTLAAFRAAWRAEVTFFTHGMMTAVTPPRSRLVVNLWHGEGPKPSPVLPQSKATVVVAATDLWGREKARMFGLRMRDVAVVGNPRLDSAGRRHPDETRRLLGVAADARVVLWLPTYRSGSDGMHATWADGAPSARLSLIASTYRTA
ncbi:CDP-glycerol glycerophosphotransferase family protein [Cellulomonas sp. ATA003]|uniref:CDP-glycerol glycerophosphotransferase family protein n=1 Tax=Cellulomonas sp. ATA003 TaxID=3073064 RepID=UPI002872F091|nr:CDP-glycerol glycerophosphotransferase family protein [Cellulomonas sp. ATA003]WNB85420.1 CDP-glycerol glycerophosphotransferase family protein [Cellulomonas sp. ATA003]